MFNSTNITIAKTRNGSGIVCQKNIHKDEVLYPVVGTLFSLAEIDAERSEFADNCFRFDEQQYLSPEGEVGWYQNHSCVPNAKIEKRANQLLVIAIRDLQQGEEILIDYSTIVCGSDPWIMQCNCGEKSCRGQIGRFENLPLHLQQKYIDQKIVPEYIRKIMAKEFVNSIDVSQ